MPASTTPTTPSTPNEPTDRYEKPGSGNDPQFAGLRAEFVAHFGGDDADDNPHNDAPINICRSPGRVNLIGEHTDYNDGFVLPMAIEPRITFAFRRRNDKQIRVASDRYDDVVTFTIDTEKGEPHWTNLLRGPVALLRKRGEVLTGMDCYLMASLPVGAGLASSAAMEVGMATAMLHLTGGDLEPQEIALLCQQAEQHYGGVPCGIMDQMIVTTGKADHAMLLDCRSLERTYVPLPADELAVVICDSKGEHKLMTGEYAKRRASCEAAAMALGVSHLRDATLDQVENAKNTLDDVTFRRARHVVTENDRCLVFAEALKVGDYAKAGQQMYASHLSLRQDYEVSTTQLDLLVAIAREIDGVYGSRMTGAGFGGSTVTLCHPTKADDIAARLSKEFAQKTGIETMAFITKAADGAKVVD